MKKTAVLATAFLLASSTAAMASGSWGYDGQTGVTVPEDWGHIAEACNGTSQSPINIVTSETERVRRISMDFDYRAETAEYLNNGHAVTAYPNSRSISISDGNGGSERYSLVQFHFHTLSEHTVNGKHYDMEMHMVHGNDAFLAGDPSGKLAVLGIFIEKGDENRELEEIFRHLPEGGHGDTVHEVLSAEVPANYKRLLPDDRKVYSYQGSLTTPGCNEIVSWFVFDEPIEMSREQIEAYRELYVDETTHQRFDTNRPVQDLNGRVVSYGKLR